MKTDADLTMIAFDFYRSKPTLFGELQGNGTLWETIDAKVAACRQLATTLITSGVFEGEAWNQAVRSAILESESD